MKILSLILITVLACIALAPGMPAFPGVTDGTPALRTLDVCHASSGSMSLDLPFVPSCPVIPAPLQLSAVQQFHPRTAKPILLVFSDERPPQHLL